MTRRLEPHEQDRRDLVLALAAFGTVAGIAMGRLYWMASRSIGQEAFVLWVQLVICVVAYLVGMRILWRMYRRR